MKVIIIDLRIGNIIYTKESESSIHYTIKYIQKYFDFISTEYIDDYDCSYNDILVSGKTKNTVEKYLNSNFYKKDYIFYEYPEKKSKKINEIKKKLPGL